MTPLYYAPPLARVDVGRFGAEPGPAPGSALPRHGGCRAGRGPAHHLAPLGASAPTPCSRSSQAVGGSGLARALASGHRPRARPSDHDYIARGARPRGRARLLLRGLRLGVQRLRRRVRRHPRAAPGRARSAGSTPRAEPGPGGALVLLYSDDLDATVHGGPRRRGHDRARALRVPRRSAVHVPRPGRQRARGVWADRPEPGGWPSGVGRRGPVRDGLACARGNGGGPTRSGGEDVARCRRPRARPCCSARVAGGRRPLVAVQPVADVLDLAGRHRVGDRRPASRCRPPTRRGSGCGRR